MIINIGTQELEFDLDHNEKKIIELLQDYSNYKVHTLGKVINMGYRETTYIFNSLRQKGVPLLGSYHGVRLAKDKKEVLDFYRKYQKRGKAYIVMYDSITKAYFDTIKKLSNEQIVSTERIKKIKR